MSMIHEKMIAIMNDVSAIGKKEKNEKQNFKFRGIDTVYNELHFVMAKHGVFTMSEIISDRHEERKSSSGGNLIYRVINIRYTFFATDGSSVQTTVIGEGMDSGDKASNKAMAVAHKYALLQAFMIPTEEEKDPDYQTHEPSTPNNPNISTINEDIEKELHRIGKCPDAMIGWEKADIKTKINYLNRLKVTNKLT